MKYPHEFIFGNSKDFAFDITTENSTWDDNHGGAAKLWWTDCVANDWEETFGTASEAIARLALIHACQESDFEKYFVNSPEKFAENFKAFLDSELSDSYENTLGNVAVLNQLEPRYSWELIPTGGGCQAIWGTSRTNSFSIAITDGDGQAPITTSQKAKAIFEVNTGTQINELHQTDFVRLDQLLPLISAKITELEEASKIDDLLANLAELAEFLEVNHLPQMSDNEREKYSEDLAEAIQLITMSEKEL